MRRAVLLSLALSGVFSCASASAPEEPPPPPRAAAAASLPLGALVTREGKVTIFGRGGAGDLRVTVERSDGVVVAEGISLDELRVRDPELHALVTSAYASNGSYVDARVSLPRAHAPRGAYVLDATGP